MRYLEAHQKRENISIGSLTKYMKKGAQNRTVSRLYEGYEIPRIRKPQTEYHTHCQSLQINDSRGFHWSTTKNNRSRFYCTRLVPTPERPWHKKIVV
jgi:hypothetical protein